MNTVRYVNMGFVAVALLTWVISAELYAALYDWFAPLGDQPILGDQFTTSDGFGLATGLVVMIALWRNVAIRGWALDVGNELSRVVWPGWEETRSNTFIVIVVTIVIAIILGIFDYLWAWLTRFIYGV
jgi:preprotein translocase SecE subunit